jgi:hypothetical protein
MVVEETFQQYQSTILQERLDIVLHEQSRCGYIIHSVPKDEVKVLVQELRQRGQYLFVTDLSENYYCDFGSSWNEFVLAMQSE